MNDIARILKEKIATEGPISVAEYMATCLYHPEHGYYMTRDPFGQNGDFTTAPEISQLFGEMLGLWVVQSWRNLGTPTLFTLVEVGPGRGTLMADTLRTLAAVSPACRAAIAPVLVEISPFLRNIQQKTLEGETVTWAESLEEAAQSGGPLILLANEVLDAFPVEQFERQKNGVYHERRVGVTEGKGFFFTPGGAANIKAERAVAEHSPGREDFLHQVKNHASAALLADYGYTKAEELQNGDTLQALKNHRKISPLESPGEADLTTHVDFAATVKTLGEKHCTLSEMAQFLVKMGLPARAVTLLEKAPPEQRAAVEAATHRLLHPDEMGRLFKVLEFRAESA